MEFFAKLFDSGDFPARWTCGRWSPEHGWLHVLSDLGIWSAYYAIPLALGVFVARRKDLPFRSIMVLFVAFILLCGTTHLMDAIIFWWPAYRLSGTIKLVTAVVSWVTVVALIRVAPTVLAMRSPAELERDVQERTAELAAVVDRLRASEAAERRRSAELEALLAAVPAYVWIAHDPDARRITGSRAAGELLRLPTTANHSLSAPPGEQPSHFRVLHNGVEVPPHDLPVQVAARGTAVRDFEMELAFDAGDRRHLFGHATPLRDDAGGVSGAVAAFVDITDRKRLEDELRRAAAELAEEGRRKDEFLSILAHELRNPLAPIRNGLQVLRLADRREVRDQARDMMDRQVTHMARLIDDLMDVSRIRRGKIVLQAAPMPVAAAVQNAVDASRPLIDQLGHTLTLDVPPDPIYVHGDNTRLSQVFANLLNNAAKYTDPGGRLRLTVARQGGEVAVAITDTGVGIPAEMLPKVFDLFTQVDRSLEKSRGGLGIGLSLVRNLVEMHGGTVTAASDGPGRGSTFTVRLPVVLAAAAPAADAAADRPGGRRILVVDDNADGAASLAAMLALQGNETRTAHDGAAAVAAAEAFHPDVILMDIGMPKLNGYDACRRIREQPGGRGVVIIAQTGWGQEDDKRRAAEAGFDFHLTKPIDPAVLQKMLAGLRPTAGVQ